MMTAGAQVTFDYSKGQFTSTMGISAVFVEQQNIFEGQYHPNTLMTMYFVIGMMAARNCL